MLNSKLQHSKQSNLPALQPKSLDNTPTHKAEQVKENFATSNVLPMSNDVAGGHISLHFTTDEKLIDKFVDLRRSLYDSDEKFQGFRNFSYQEKEDYMDENAHVLVAMKNGKCIAGARLNVSRPDKRVRLPLEKSIHINGSNEDFDLIKAFPEYNLAQCNYAELTRMAIAPEYRDNTFTEAIFRKIMNAAEYHNVTYMFGVSDILRSRLYKKLYTRLGHSVIIHKHFDISDNPDYENHKMYLMSMKLNFDTLFYTNNHGMVIR